MEDPSPGQEGRLRSRPHPWHVPIRLHAALLRRQRSSIPETGRIQHDLVILRRSSSPSSTNAHRARQLSPTRPISRLPNPRSLRHNFSTHPPTTQPRRPNPRLRPINSLHRLRPLKIQPHPPNLHPLPRPRHRTQPLRPNGPLIPPPPNQP